MTDPLAKLRDRKIAPTLSVLSKTRSCDGCDVCCTAPGITDPKLTKAPGVPCQHLAGEAGRSCMIYEKRPRTCRLFYCLWRSFDHILPEWMDPKVCGFMLAINNAYEWPTVITVHPMPDRPKAWETLWHQTVFSYLAERWNCLVAIGQSPDHTTHIFCPDGSRLDVMAYPPDQRKIIVRDDGFIGAPDFVFGPDQRPLAYRLFEIDFRWGIAPPPGAA